MKSSCARAARWLALASWLVAGTPPTATAVEERGWLSIDGGSAFYDPEQALKDSPVYGARVAGYLNRCVGIEAMYHTSSPKLESPATGDATYTHYGANLIITPDRYRWVLPYIYAGAGNAKVERGSSSGKGESAVHGGVGVMVRAGERFGFRLDARDVSFKQEGGPGRDTRVNNVEITAGLAALWFGRPRDTDEDGVPNKRDRCPETPRGAVVDAGGCPLDTDQDKVFDGLDKCPGTPAGAVVDGSGCPVDTDKDGVPDGIDRCDSTMTGVIVDASGCGVDSDKDGVFDGIDKCADTPAGSRVDASGCPLDADQDGVPDGVDICPATPAGEAVNAGGCPVVPSRYELELRGGWMMTLTDLEFEPDSARVVTQSAVRLTPAGIARVDSIGQILAQWPMLKFEIAAHVDNGPDAPRRQPLTHFRARAVLQEIISKHPTLNPKNYWFTGYADTEPIASNATAAGRAANRRIEFRLMNMVDFVKERERRDAFGSTPAPPAPGLEPRMPAPPDQPPPGQAPTPGQEPPPGEQPQEKPQQEPAPTQPAPAPQGETPKG